MIRTTYNDVDLFLLNDSPNWKAGFNCDFKVGTLDQQASLSQRETRRPYSSTILTTMNFTVVVRDSALNQLVGCLKQLKDQPVLAPFWPAVSFFKDLQTLLITGGLMVAFKADWSQWALYKPGFEPAWLQPLDLICPVVYGFIEDKTVRWANTTLGRWQVKLQESSQYDYSLEFNGQVPPFGPLPAGYAESPKIVAFQQDHRDTAETFNVVISREDGGFTREKTTTFYNHEVMRGQTSQYVLRGLREVSDFISFYKLYAAVGASFWVRSPFQACSLMDDALAADATVTVVDASQLVGDDWVCARVNEVDHYAQVKTVLGNTVTFHDKLGIDLPAGYPLYPLTLAKMAGSSVSVRFPSVALAVGKLSWMELKPEETLPNGEVVGETIGQMPTKVILFHFWRDYGNGTVDDWYFTSFEDAVQYAGNEYLPANINLGDGITSVNLQDDALDITTFIFDGNPLNDEAGLQSETVLNVEIFVGELKI